MINTGDFPQADRLLQVGQVALAVAAGHHDDVGITAYIGLIKTPRQGRYYRLAAETLGLIKNENNNSSLTLIGEEYVTLLDGEARIDFLSRCLIETEVFKTALQYIREYEPTEAQLRAWFRTFYPGAPVTANRRYRTFVSYLRDTDLVTYAGEKIKVRKYSGSIAINKDRTMQPQPSSDLVGSLVTKTVSGAPSISAAGTLTVDVDLQKRERASQIHWKLIAAKAEFLTRKGYIPKENGHVDLYISTSEDTIFYEMKSVDTQGRNLLSQVRKAVSQLYEYRFIFGKPTARISIVTNAQIPESDKWLIDYLSADRQIAYEWTEDFSSFKCPEAAKRLLGGFSPLS